MSLYLLIVNHIEFQGLIVAFTRTFFQTTMNNLLYLIAVILVIGWAVGFFAFHSTGIIHILLAIAVIAIIFRLIRGDKVL
jgi:hypothetical protein